MTDSSSARILIVDDEPHQCAMLKLVLSREGAVVETETSPQEALERATREDFSVVLADLNMGDNEMSGLTLSERLLEARPDLPIVLITGDGSVENAIGAVRAGVFDFLVKPVESHILWAAMHRAIRSRKLHEELRRIQQKPGDPPTASMTMIGESTAMKRLYDVIDRLRGSTPATLISGEPGSGKDLVVRALHNNSSNRNGPLLTLSCAMTSPALVEAELFGHARGLASGGDPTRHGLLVQARGGTLVLDEVCELSLEVQSKLLQALEERAVRPLGSTLTEPFDTRLISVTNRDLPTEVDEGRFREDLFYRLNVVTVPVPPLRERGSDVLELANHFIQMFRERDGKKELKLSAAAAERLMEYDWPSNVRELQHSMERAVAMARFDQITIEDLPDRIRSYRPDKLALSTNHPDEILPLDELERRYIWRVLKLVGGNKTKAAQLLGLDRRTLYRKLERRE